MSTTESPSRIAPAEGERRLCSAITETPGSVSASANGRALGALAQRGLQRGERHARAPALDLVARRLDDLIENAHATGASFPVSRTRPSSDSAAAPESTAASATRTPSSSVSARPAT